MGTFGFARENEFDAVIWRTGAALGVDPALIKAVIAQESGFDPYAVRLEPKLQDASRGLMQVLLRTAQWLGYAGPPSGLFDPETNLLWGSKYLAWQLGRYGGSAADAAAAYNAGTATRDAGGAYSNQAYVDKVLHYYGGYVSEGATAAPSETPPDLLQEVQAGGIPPADVTESAPAPAPAPEEPSPVTPTPPGGSLLTGAGSGDFWPMLAVAGLFALVAVIGFARGRG